MVYKIRKLTVGVCSVGIMAGCYFATTSAQAADNDQVEQDALVSKQSFAQPETSTSAATTEVPIADETLRMQFEKLPDSQVDNVGLWVWGPGVKTPSENWPSGALSFSEEQHNDDGYYVDVSVKPSATEVNYLLNNKTTGDKFTEDLSAEIVSPQQDVVYINDKYEASDIPPLPQTDTLRVHYQREDNDYQGWGLWVWGDVKHPSQDWPTGAIDFTQADHFGRYVDVPLNADSQQVQFLLVNKITQEQSKDLQFDDLQHHQQIFLTDKETAVNTSPFTTTAERITYAEQLSPTQIEISFSKNIQSTSEELLKNIHIINDQQVRIDPQSIDIIPNTAKLQLTGAFNQQPLSVHYGDDQLTVQQSWKYKDAVYGYTGDLGATLHEDGTAQLTLWSPSAQQVDVILYDKKDPDKIVATLPMTQQQGVWQIDLSQDNTGLASLNHYYYHYQITRDGEQVLALDPYAKSLAEWNQSTAKEKVAKAAIVNPSQIGPQLRYATIDNYGKREDAIIYEAHVRDFTSDPHIATQLTAPFGTFSAFSERLDYLQKLGVTHIQLMPIMSYYYADEQLKNQRELTPTTNNNNYNWGYDPQSYFALTGMYSKDSQNPEARIAEFKQLVKAIHDKGMGVILDVVYNHTARTFIFEDLEPHYYHFMNADGTPRESFGGGRLGTTHQMARRILVDSIKYWTDEYKVDGFRFDMMGDHDAESIQMAYDEAKKLNPNILMLGEGWRTYTGDEQAHARPADQDWVQDSNSVGVFSDDIRNELKSGYPSEGEPRFLTGGARNIQHIYDNIIAQPHNFKATAPGDVIQYIAAHDNLTLHDVIAQSIKKDPEKYAEEIHQRIRLGNLMILTSQGTPFLHSGQEMGRTKQLIDDKYQYPVENAPYKTHYLTDAQGKPFNYPYFVHDSYDSSDSINRFDWHKALSQPLNVATREYTTGLIQLRKSTDAFRYGTMAEVLANSKLLQSPDINYDQDLVIAYQMTASNGDIYAIFINADSQSRTIHLSSEDQYLTIGQVIVDGQQAGVQPINQPSGVHLSPDAVELSPLTAVIIKVSADVPTPVVKVKQTPKVDEVKVTPATSVEKMTQTSNETTSQVTPTSQQVTPQPNTAHTATQQVTPQPNTAHTTTKTLPKTGQSQSMWMTVAGILGLLALGKYLRKKS